MRSRIWLSFFLSWSLFPSVWALDPSCFRETATVSSWTGETLQIMTDSSDTLWFVQDGSILPSQRIERRDHDTISYTLSGVTGSDAVIRDGDPLTTMTIDPYELARHPITIDIDLGRIYSADTIQTHIDIRSEGEVRYQISQDGRGFVTTDLAHIDEFPQRYIRIVFMQPREQYSPTRIRDIIIRERRDEQYITTPILRTPVTIYRGPTCQIAPPRRYDRLPSETPALRVVFGSNPLYKNDTDSDTIDNLRDNCPNIANPSQSDRDHDGVGDACSDDDQDGIVGDRDNCPTLANPDQSDKNVNGIGDVCEFDTVGDGVPDGGDNAIHSKNPDQRDEDHDGIGDVIDNCTLYNPDQLDLDKNQKGDICDADLQYRQTHDQDRDGILDASDNCPTLVNPDQTDSDQDGIGDACDNCRMLQNSDQRDTDKNNIGDMCDDSDRDSIEGWRDNCPTLANPDQRDSNNDRIGDVCSDTDGDSILDGVDNCVTTPNTDQGDIDHDRVGDICDTRDDRFLESNRYLFMGILGFLGVLFIGGIFFLLRKLR